VGDVVSQQLVKMGPVDGGESLLPHHLMNYYESSGAVCGCWYVETLTDEE
jgi:hypothetical protein